MNKFLNENYDEIVKMSGRICKGSNESIDVAHHCIASFLEHKRAQELVDKGEAMKFLSGMIWRSFHSSTSPYHKLYRQGGRVHELYERTLDKEVWEEYDIDIDLTIEAIQGMLEEMEAEGVEQWFRATLFKMWIEEPNYSELHRMTKIPRTSISQAVNECRQYIKETLNKRGIE